MIAIQPKTRQILGVNQQAYQSLKASMSLNLRRQLLIAVCDNVLLQNQLATQLENDLAQETWFAPQFNAGPTKGRSLSLERVVFDPEDAHLPRQVAHWVRQMTLSAGNLPEGNLPQVQVLGIEQMTRQPAIIQNHFLRSLEQVEALLPRLNTSLLVWVPWPWLRTIQSSSPTFWKWRNAVFEFVSDPTPTSLMPSEMSPSESRSLQDERQAERFAEEASTLKNARRNAPSGGVGLSNSSGDVPSAAQRDRANPLGATPISNGAANSPANSNYAQVPVPEVVALYGETDDSELGDDDQPVLETIATWDAVDVSAVSLPPESAPPESVSPESAPPESTPSSANGANASTSNGSTNNGLDSGPNGLRSRHSQNSSLGTPASGSQPQKHQPDLAYDADSQKLAEQRAAESEWAEVLNQAEERRVQAQREAQRETAQYLADQAADQPLADAVSWDDYDAADLAHLERLREEEEFQAYQQAEDDRTAEETRLSAAMNRTADYRNDVSPGLETQESPPPALPDDESYLRDIPVPEAIAQAPAAQASAEHSAADDYFEVGHSYRRRIEAGERGLDLIEPAIAAYEGGLRCLSGPHPDWGSGLNDLGTLYWLKAQQLSDPQQVVDCMRHSVELYSEALTKIDSAQAVNMACQLYSNLGAVYSMLATQLDPVHHFTQAAEAYLQALPLCSLSDDPEEFATLQNSLGSVYWKLSHYEQDAELVQLHLRQAITAYEQALLGYSPSQRPLDYAAVQNNLGITYWSLAKHEVPVSALKNAIAAYRDALNYRTPDSEPAACAITYNNLALAYWDLSKDEGIDKDHKIRYQRNAVTAFEAALQTAGTVNSLSPTDRAAIYHCLGDVHAQMVESGLSHSEVAESLQKSLYSYIQAIEGMPEESPVFQARLSAIIANLKAHQEHLGLANQQAALNRVPSYLISRVMQVL